MLLGGRIREVRQKNGLTQKEFAQSLGIVQGFLSGIEHGKKKFSDTLLIALCHQYGISRDWLRSGRGQMEHKHRATGGSVQDLAIPLFKKIPQDFPNHFQEDDIDVYISLPGESQGSYAIFVSGDFMAPTICDGDLVIISQKGEIANRDIVLVNNRWGEAILRRYRVVGTEVFLSPDNHVYAPFQKDNKVKVLGRVMEVWRKIKL